MGRDVPIARPVVRSLVLALLCAAISAASGSATGCGGVARVSDGRESPSAPRIEPRAAWRSPAWGVLVVTAFGVTADAPPDVACTQVREPAGRANEHGQELAQARRDEWWQRCDLPTLAAPRTFTVLAADGSRCIASTRARSLVRTDRQPWFVEVARLPDCAQEAAEPVVALEGEHPDASFERARYAGPAALARFRSALREQAQPLVVAPPQLPPPSASWAVYDVASQGVTLVVLSIRYVAPAPCADDALPAEPENWVVSYGWTVRPGAAPCPLPAHRALRPAMLAWAPARFGVVHVAGRALWLTPGGLEEITR